ncbi:MAG TPA: DUF6220 domain-containing protein [Gaiellaceae bacterium]|jgi:hypothetical protein|nr:DUF6220 domain-containing protein [Gaiellaceae bacterium]
MAAVRRGAWGALRYVTSLFFLGVVVQFFLVGYGLFAMKHGATIDDAKSLDPHRGLGWILSEFGSILMLILVLLARPARRLLGAWILLAVLAFFQAVLASSGYHHWGLGMFHPVNAIILLGLSGRLAHYAWTTGKSADAVAAPVTAPTG